MGFLHGFGTPEWARLAVTDLDPDWCDREAGWDLMVKWTKAHTAKAAKAKMTAEQRQIALGDDVAGMLANRGAEGDGAFAAECNQGKEICCD